MFIKTRWLIAWAGRDLARNLPAYFGFVLFPFIRDGARHGVLRGRLYFDASWSWLPFIYRVRNHWSSRFGYSDVTYADSAAWTGREFHVIGWRWPLSITVGFGLRWFSFATKG